MNSTSSILTAKDLLSAKAIRDQAARIVAHVENGQGHFKFHVENLEKAADYVVDVIKARYPDLAIPYHSRWSHFQIGGVDRLGQLAAKLAGHDDIERARARFDLVIISVLLDAGAGPKWQYQEPDTGRVFARSEGLAVASLHMFTHGLFSSDPDDMYKVDGCGLKKLKKEDLERGFQASVGNPLTGVDGRLKVLHSLGRALKDRTDLFSASSRPGGLIDYILKEYPNKKITGEQLLQLVLEGFGSIWPGRITLDDIPLGDVWYHRALGSDQQKPAALIPFHKLSQWLTYSLIEPLQEVGVEVTDVDGLTALAEYRNGGMLLDLNVIELVSDEPDLEYRPDSEVVIEWRALTINLIDRLAHSVRKKLGKTSIDLPLAKVLEGGTWWAGRKLANEKRQGQPPLKILSDGTVF